MINSIIDLSHHNRITPAAAHGAGVIAIIHKATEGTDFRDKQYHEVKQQAQALGLLWGSYHFSNNRPVEEQVDNYLSCTNPGGDEVICLDFEHNDGKEMSLEQAEQFVLLVNKRLGRFPMLYGGAWLREQLRVRPSAVLGNCPLWYRRYAPQPKALPTHVWRTYTLWQYTDGAQGGLPHAVNGIACDRSYFNGSEADLKARWPFTQSAP